MKKVILAVAILALSGCAASVGNPYADAANKLIQTRQAAQAAAVALSSICTQKGSLLNQATCQEVAKIYAQLPTDYQAANAALVESVASQSGISADYQTRQTALLDLLNKLNAVLLQYKGAK